MLSKERIIRDCLLSRQIGQLVGRGRVVRVAFAIVAILQDHTQAIEAFHQDLNNTRLQVRETTLARRLTTDVQEHRPSRLVISGVKEVPLWESAIVVRQVAVTVREMVDRLVNGIRLVAIRPLSALEM